MTKPLILNIEAATDVCSVCLSLGTKVLSLCESSVPNEHSRAITLLIQQCMNDGGLRRLNNLDAVAVSEGPGSYTSLRVGFSTVKGICYAFGKPLIAVNTLAALAVAAHNEAKLPNTLYCGMIDARRMDVYAALFDAVGSPLFKPQPMTIKEGLFSTFFEAGQKIIFCGNGAEKCVETLKTPLAVLSNVKKCSSVQIIPLAMTAFLNKNFVDVASAVPTYLKPPNITTPRPK